MLTAEPLPKLAAPPAPPSSWTETLKYELEQLIKEVPEFQSQIIVVLLSPL